MNFTALIGDDAICARQLQHRLLEHDGTTVERLDASQHPVHDIVASVLAQSLFTPAQVVVIDQLDKLTGSNLELVASAAVDSVNYLYGVAKTLSATQRKTLTTALGERFLVVEHPALDGKRGHETVDLVASSAGVTLSRQVRQLLLTRVGHEPARLQSVIEQCRIGGFMNPTVAQINVLCGTASAAGVPWDLSDYLERGDRQAAIDACTNAVPLATLAYLGNRYQQAMRIIEAEATTSDDAATAAGTKSAYTADRLLQLSRRLGRERLAQVIVTIAEGDLIAKQHGVDGLRIVIGRLAPLFAIPDRARTQQHN